MRWKYILQQALGGVKRVPGAAAHIVDSRVASNGLEQCTRLGITPACLSAFFLGKAPVLVFQGAVPLDVCDRAARRLEQAVAPAGTTSTGNSARCFEKWHLGVDPDAPASDYLKIGYTKTDVLREEGFRMTARAGATKRYLDSADETRRFLEEEVFSAGNFPIADLVSELGNLSDVLCQDEKCPVTGRPFLPCVVRGMGPGGRRPDGNIHMDVVVPGCTLSVNVYLRVPEEDSCGGELVLYPVKKDFFSRLLNDHFFTTLEIQNFYQDKTFYAQKLLTSGNIEPIVYKPKVGDVVIIDPAFPHAVRDFESSSSGLSRISLQTFVQASLTGPQKVRKRLLRLAV